MAKTQSLRARKRRGVKKKSAGFGLSLQATFLVAMVTFTIILWAATFWTQLLPLQQLQGLRDTAIRAQDEHLAYSIGLKVARYTEAAHAVALDPHTRALLLARDKAAIAKREDELRVLFPWVITVRLLPAGIRNPVTTSEPHISYAGIDMMREAETTLKAPPVEVHVLGTPQQHIDIIEPVLDTSGKKVIGHVQVALKTDLLKQWVRLDSAKGYVQLKQKLDNRKSGLLLADAGNASLQNEVVSAEVAVPGTRWRLSFWGHSDITLNIFNTNLLMTYFIGGLMNVLLILLLWRALSRAVTRDVETYTQLVLQKARGEGRHQYQFLLKEFQAGARQIESYSMPTTMERERDDDSGSSLSVNSLSLHENLDPMFIDEDSMSVEELDDSAMRMFEKQAGGKAETTATSSQSLSSQNIAKTITDQGVQPATTAEAKDLPAIPPEEIFKAYDIRGIVGQTLTSDYMALIGQALGSEAIERGLTRISFARDGRLSGPELGQGLVKGLLAAGIDVVDVGMVPTPVLYYAAEELTDGTGVMLTGSHNPANYNGIKMVLGGETLAGETIQRLRQRIVDKDFLEGTGQYRTQPVSNDYIERVVSDVKLERPLKVVVDCGNGVAGGMAPKLFRELGCEVIELYSEVDGNFPNHHPDPSQPENLQDLIEMVRATDADIGLAFDGDGDRLGVVSPDGSIVWPDRLMMLFAADVIGRNPGAQIIFDIKCSSNLTREIWEKGGEPLMWKTGHSLIKAKMKQSGALLAGEMSGHIFFKERWYGFDDALYSGARLLEILAADSRPVQQVFASLPDAVNTPELRVEMPQSELNHFMEEILSKADFPEANVTMIDGIRADFETGWGLLRASNTTPSLILRFEGRDQAALEEVQDKFREIMLEINPGLNLPF